MRVGQRTKMLGQPLPPFGCADAFDAGRKRFCFACSAECKYLVASQQSLNGSSKPGPKFDLAGDGTLTDFPHEASVQNQGVRDFHRLTYTATVAKCYLAVKEQPQPQTRTSINARLAESQLERSLPPNPQAE